MSTFFCTVKYTEDGVYMFPRASTTREGIRINLVADQ